MVEGPIRALQYLGSLNRGGIETWLVNIARERSPELHLDFFLLSSGGVYEEDVKRLGCRIYCVDPRSPLDKARHLFGRGIVFKHLREVLSRGRYDALHVHGDEFFGDAMKAAADVGIPVRVAHCHNTVLARGKKGPLMMVRRLRFRTVDRRRTQQYATDIVACSRQAGFYFMGEDWQSDARCRPLFCGVTRRQFRESLQKWTRESFRKECGVPSDALVIGHAGSMGPSPQKNHFFLLKIFSEVAKRDPRYFLYLAGDGPLRPAIEAAVRARGLESRVAMPGLCNNVPGLMVHCFDVHLLPSLQEGLPVVGLEAVAAGLYTVCSKRIPTDFTEYFADRVATVSLEEPLRAWADRVEAAFARRIPLPEGLALLEQSPFSIESSLAAMVGLYRQRLAGGDGSSALDQVAGE